jgi:hypothetical protein
MADVFRTGCHTFTLCNAIIQRVSMGREKIRGLWKRGHKYYAQLRMEVGDGQTRPKMIPLQAATLDQARAELEKTRTHNREGKLPSPGHRPLFSAFADEYLKSPIHGQKKQSTRDGESRHSRILEEAPRWRSPR